MDIKLNKDKKILSFYMGYTPPFNGINYNHRKVYGSEINAIKLAELLSYNFNVIIFVYGIYPQEEITYNGVKYLDCIRIKDFETIDIMIIVRFINYFIYFKNIAKKTFIWVTDNIINPFYNGIRLENQGLNLLNNVKQSINNIICLSDYHKNNLITVFNENKYYNQIPIKIISNSINTDYIKDNPIKIKNRFIYMTKCGWGLLDTIRCFKLIQQKIPDASICITRKEEFDEDIIKELQDINYLTLFNKLSQEELSIEMLKSEFFLYCNTVCETFSNCCAEAQLYKCICIYNNIGALNTTIGDRGIPINFYNDNKDIYYIRVSELVINLINDNDKKNDIKKRGFEYAKTLNINNISKLWLDIL